MTERADELERKMSDELDSIATKSDESVGYSYPEAYVKLFGPDY